MIKIKRILLLLVTLAICLSFAACDSSERLMDKYLPDSESNNDVGDVSENVTDNDWPSTDSKNNSNGNSIPEAVVRDCVGEWKMFMGFDYSADGRAQRYDLVTLVINADGTLTFNGTPGSWHYDGVEKAILAEAPEADFSAYLKKVTYEGHDGLNIVNNAFGEEVTAENTFLKENPDNYQAACDTLIGDWFSENYSFSFMSDGSYYENGEPTGLSWKVTCLGPDNILVIGDGQMPSLFEIGAYYLNGCYSLSSPKVTQITPDNWRNYFSENLADNFDVVTKALTDEWGDSYTEEVLKLKTSKNYVEEDSYLVIEFETFYEDGTPYIDTIDVSVTGENDIPYKYGDNCRITRMRGLLIEE